MLSRKKVLIVLDDVNSSEQIDYLVGIDLGSGSTIIITSRDKGELRDQVDYILEVRELDPQQSHELFCSKAFKKLDHNGGYEEVSEKVVSYARGIPLALTVLGSALASKTPSECKLFLKKLQKFPYTKIQDVLKVSYDGLDEWQKKIFLDIACFWKGEYVGDLIRLLNDLYNIDFSIIEINTLRDKSLIIISYHKVEMHDLIQEMGKEIVRQENTDNIGGRSRLWNSNDICNVLKSQGTDAVKSIVFNMSRCPHIDLDPDIFRTMHNIKYLKFYTSELRDSCNLDLPYGLNSLPNLRFLYWHGYPSKSLPSTFNPQNLVQFCMPKSRVEKLWNGIQELGSLKIINLSYCENLIELPDLSRASELEIMNLSFCSSLIEIPSWLQHLNKLRHLNLESCHKLELLPTNIRLSCLEEVNCRNCSSLKDFMLTSKDTVFLFSKSTLILRRNERPYIQKVDYAIHVASTGLFHRSWEAIRELSVEINSNNQTSPPFSLGFKVREEANLKIIAFGTSPVCTQFHLQVPGAADLVSSSTLKETYNFPEFDFLCTRKYPSFSVNKAAISFFSNHRDQLSQLKSQINSSTPLIVTGHALGGSIASLFTLWLLDSTGSSKNRPLCITFGSPLLADKNMQQAISRSSTWNSCFLHVVFSQDPVPRSFLSHSSSVAEYVYQPFGTFFFCSDNGSTCFESPDSILVLLMAMGSTVGPNQGLQTVDYGNVLENLHRKAICSDFATQPEEMTHSSSLPSISLELWALGFSQMQQQQQNYFKEMAKKIEREELKFILQKRKVFDPTKKLNDMKIQMAKLEWYKKFSKTEGSGYFDSYKNERFLYDREVVATVRGLTHYWKDMVEEAEMKPQKKGAAFRTRWLIAGTSYRRMVEPLDIAEYYKDGKTDYKTQGRSKHYKLLEAWLEEGRTFWRDPKKKNVELLLTLDSCFWAYVEEALLLCKQFPSLPEKQIARQKLTEYENYFFENLKSYAVSPEIFLEKSSYMHWWNEYQKILKNEAPCNSPLALFMSNAGNYKKYGKGEYDFP